MFGKHWGMGFVVLVLCAVGTVGAQEAATPSTRSTLQIAQHRFGLDVVDREIDQEVESFHVGDVLYLWMRVEGGPADPITVTWASGDVSYDVELSIGGSPWRTWARKTLFRPGSWNVQVKDATGEVLYEQTLEVLETTRSNDQ